MPNKNVRPLNPRHTRSHWGFKPTLTELNH